MSIVRDRLGVTFQQQKKYHIIVSDETLSQLNPLLVNFDNSNDQNLCLPYLSKSVQWHQHVVQ